jgi:hypothetical protein
MNVTCFTRGPFIPALADVVRRTRHVCYVPGDMSREICAVLLVHSASKPLPCQLCLARGRGVARGFSTLA